ncbi:amidohydrolase family protein [Microbacterium sp. CBA3102]|uniref:amidohydrolase family protein n=1 Tax=Microbacterium sp. CBA3102 TaxID=2603598 RepID=UPI0011BB4467|nr:amidohydrolase family protein [Microbacterium sp. CBA3102]QEA27201.1 amidohydrolase family protein [Microbacterium sp. CBA3102]
MITIAEDRRVLLTGARIFDGRSEYLRDGLDILVDADGVIAGLGATGTLDAGDARVIDLASRILSPGLINMHVHLGLALPGTAGAEIASKGDTDLLLVMADSARRTLHAGVTTARLVGESRYLDFALRRGIEAGIIAGPRLYTAGHALCCTGGHGWESDALEGDGADDLRRLTRLQIRHGADLIKVCISGGIAGEHEQIDTPQLTDDEMAAVIQTAHDWGRKVTAHVGPSETLRRAIELGLDCVEHGYELTREVTDLMSERGVWYVPTITVSRCEEFFDAQGVPTWMKERALGAGPRHWESLENAIASGVRIAMGTDMPPAADFDGTTATVREMEFMVDAGMTSLDVMRSATSYAAELLGADDLGVVEVGARADLIATDTDPTADVAALRGIDWVMQGGAVLRDDRAGR